MELLARGSGECTSNDLKKPKLTHILTNTNVTLILTFTILTNIEVYRKFHFKNEKNYIWRVEWQNSLYSIGGGTKTSEKKIEIKISVTSCDFAHYNTIGVAKTVISIIKWALKCVYSWFLLKMKYFDMPISVLVL